jgi:threonylcarbamoyladenosine tRNA methylthiotransferase MtaB
MEAEELERLAERVVVVSLDEKPSLLGLPGMLANRLVADIDLYDAVRQCTAKAHGELATHPAGPFDYDAATFSFHSRAFLKIQDGCDNACAYCRVTIARGDAVSLAHQDVLERSMALERELFKEIVLTGVNISAYRSNDVDLAGLLGLLLDRLGPAMRIRLSSLEPDRLDPQLIELFADVRIQPHFHLPVQSGSNAVLRRVDRHYDVERLVEAVGALRKVKGDPFIAADMITGLPGETDEEFERSLELVKDLDFSQLHVFPFSPRPRTALYEARDRVSERVRDERAKMLRNLSAVHLRRYMERQVGTEAEVILEQRQNGVWSGLTGNYLHVRVLGVPAHLAKGALVPIALERDGRSGMPVGRYRGNQTPE